MMHRMMMKYWILTWKYAENDENSILQGKRKLYVCIPFAFMLLLFFIELDGFYFVVI